MAGHNPSWKPHAVVLPFPLQGHITPLMQLSKLLVARGFDVTFVSTHYNVAKMLQAKQAASASSSASAMAIRLLGIPDGLPASHPRDSSGDIEAFMASLLNLHAPFDELVRQMLQEQGLHITCIISDSFLLWSQDVANKWRIPRVSFWPQSLTAFACSISLPRIMAAYPNLDPFKPEVFYGEACRVQNCIPGLPDISTSRLPFFALAGDVVGVNWLRHHLQVQMDRVNEPLCVICNTFPDLEEEVLMHLKPPLLSKPILTVGPLLPSAFLGGQDDKGTGSSLYDEDEECLHWLDGQLPRSVLYISLGSFATLDERDLVEIATGLEACDVPFLWVIRSLTHESTVAVKHTQKGKVIQWAPQLRVLSHEAIGGFFTHCGWNSTLESVSLGVPVIGWPQMMDQNTNCWFQVEKLKVGLQLTSDASGKIGHVGVEKAVRILMQEEEGHHMRVRASNFASLAQRAFKTSLASNLDSLVHTILAS